MWPSQSSQEYFNHSQYIYPLLEHDVLGQIKSLMSKALVIVAMTVSVAPFF